MLRPRHLALAGFVVAMLTALAVADTGGSMGGGSWGGGGGGGTSSSSSSSSGGGGGYSYSSDDSSGSSGSGRGWTKTEFALVCVLGVVALIWYVADSRRDLAAESQVMSAATYDYAAVDISVLRIAIDGRARKFVQTELAQIAHRADTKTAVGRLAMLGEVSMMLRRLRDAWVYGGAVTEPMRSEGGAQATFASHVTAARLKFQEETVRNVDGVTTTRAASEYIPRSYEGDGLILVTLVVAARSELFTVNHIADGEDLRKALEAAPYRNARDLVAIEIIWQPSEDTDRLSSMELEAKYPPPALIPLQGALVGKVFCDYCSGPFPGELVCCPHCGGRAPGRDPATRAA